MKILAVQEADWIERNPIMHHRMLEALSRAGDEVIVLDYPALGAARTRAPLTRGSVVTGVHKFYADANVELRRPAMLHVRGLTRLSWLIASWLELKGIVSRRRPDVIVVYGISNALLATVMARQAGIPLVYHLLDALHALAEPRYLRPIARWVEAAVLRCADEVLVINHHLTLYVRQMGRTTGPITVVPVGYEPREVPPAEADRVRAALGVSHEDLLLLFVGWLYEFSGLRELALELRDRRSDLPHVKLVVVGSGHLYGELSGLSRGDLSGMLVMTGQVPRGKVEGYIGASDLCLLPARHTLAMNYIVPAKVSEYLELGKPAIVSRLPGLEAAFRDVDGVVWIDSPAHCVDFLVELSRNGNARRRANALGQSCRAFAERQADWDSVIRLFRSRLELAGPRSMNQ